MTNEIRMMSPSELIPYENNPRFNDAAVDQVAESIKAFGFRSPIIVDRKMVVIAGHTRLKAAEKLGLKEVPKVLVEFLRINPFIEKAMPYLDTSDWSLKAGGYRHLPLERKKEIIAPLIASGKEISVCEDVPEHYEYWRDNVNHNPNDCCNLRRRS